MNKMQDIKRYIANFDEQESYIEMMSIVDLPAVQEEFLAYSDTSFSIDYKIENINDDERIINGVAMRADFPIARAGGKVEVIFPKEEIKKFSLDFMKNKRTDKVDIQHSGNLIDGMYLFESLIISDKVKHSDFPNIEDGSWITSYKVDNDYTWNKIKSRELTGFSIKLNGFKLKEDVTEFRDLYNTLKQLKYEQN